MDYGLGLCGPEGAEESGVVGGGVLAGNDETADRVAVVIGIGLVGPRTHRRSGVTYIRPLLGASWRPAGKSRPRREARAWASGLVIAT